MCVRVWVSQCVINANKIIWFIEYASGHLCFTAQCSRVAFLGGTHENSIKEISPARWTASARKWDREWKIRCADTPTTDMYRKTNVHLHCMLAQLFFIYFGTFFRSSTFYSCLPVLAFFFRNKTLFLTSSNTNNTWNLIGRMLFRPVFPFDLLF